MWPDRRITDLFRIEFPILLAPMAGVMDADLAIAVAEGGGLASLPCAMISPEKAREQVGIVRQRVSAPVNLNFFCHQAVDADAAREAIWRKRLTPYYREHGLDPAMPVDAANRAPSNSMTFGRCLSIRLPDRISSPMMMTPNAIAASFALSVIHQ